MARRPRLFPSPHSLPRAERPARQGQHGAPEQRRRWPSSGGSSGTAKMPMPTQATGATRRDGPRRTAVATPIVTRPAQGLGNPDRGEAAQDRDNPCHGDAGHGEVAHGHGPRSDPERESPDLAPVAGGGAAVTRFGFVGREAGERERGGGRRAEPASAQPPAAAAARTVAGGGSEEEVGRRRGLPPESPWRATRGGGGLLNLALFFILVPFQRSALLLQFRKR
ncbi:hypothetical protein PVAP13_6NG123515 [Panicum virgatum]|uniref:Uncharacterized protein n=1 Tax=Panicum virgatum TaxID=38727 RepID=A0A8T0R0A0_PANVG|nr:hypothetical protein PVAP13_6NG123515 [Panicum virgatum]